MAVSGPPARFRPRFPWLGADLQTLRDFFDQPSEGVPSQRCERLEFLMPDGSGDRLLGDLDTPLHPVANRPLAILIHGLTGCSDSFYMRRAARTLLMAGFPTLRLNLRGAGLSRDICRFQYHSGRSEDLRTVIGQLDAANGIVLVGWSLGANMLLKCLAEVGAQETVLGAVAVSTPLDLAATARRFQAPRNALYHRWMLNRMKLEALAAGVEMDGSTRERLARVQSVIEFDDVFTAPMNGFAGADDYYQRCSARRFLSGVAVPTLVIHALDDPWIPAWIYRQVEWADLPTFKVLLPSAGGHVGFHAAEGVWSDAQAVAFLSALSDGRQPVRSGTAG